MESEEKNQQLTEAKKKNIVLSLPGQLLSRMTNDLLPLANYTKTLDDERADPSFKMGIDALSDKRFQIAEMALSDAAKLGHSRAQFELAMMYLDGLNGPKNFYLAYQWFHRSAEQGDADSMNKLGWMCEAGFGVERDHARAVNWFRQAAERGHLEAQYNLAAKYDNGEGVSQNYAEAARWYRLSAEQGFADARFFLAQALEFGEGLPRNMDEAIDWYILAAEQNHRSAKVTLWGHALAGNYIPEDDLEMLFIEKLGVEMGSPLAEYKLAFRMLIGEAVQKDIKKSFNLYEKSARHGFSPARAHLALINTLDFDGASPLRVNNDWKNEIIDFNSINFNPTWMFLGVGSSIVSDVVRYRQNRIRAEGGDEDAVSELACDYFFGRGTPQSHELALRWLHIGIEFHDPYCNYLLGYMLSQGVGLIKDEKKALIYLKKAAAKGNMHAGRLAAAILLRNPIYSKGIKQAITILSKQAERGDANSQLDLGNIFANGEHVLKSNDTAVLWYEKAADQGNSAALFNLAYSYEFGIGVEIDLQHALYLYHESAERGLIRACETLSKIYQEDKFGVKSSLDSQKWINEALRLKIDVDNKNSVAQRDGGVGSTNSSRRARLEKKRSLKVRAIEIIENQ